MWTEVDTKIAVDSYKKGLDTQQIAEVLGRSARSIVAKLSSEGVYQTKSAQKPRVTKAEMVARPPPWPGAGGY